MNIDLPKLIEADDESDFEYLEGEFQKLDKRFRCDEIGFITREYPGYSTYLGIVYTGRKPSRKKTKEIVSKTRLKGVNCKQISFTWENYQSINPIRMNKNENS